MVRKGKNPRLLMVGFLRQSLAFSLPCVSVFRNHFSLAATYSPELHQDASASTCIVLPFKNTSLQSDSDLLCSQAVDLSAKLGLPLVTEEDDDTKFTHSLHLLPYSIAQTRTFALAIRPVSHGDRHNKSKKSQMTPFLVDFCPSEDSRMGKRLGRHDNQPHEILLKAISKKGRTVDPSSGPIIFDLTAGFAQDTMIMVQAASQVHMVERNPIVAQLLQDALRRMHLVASQDPSKIQEYERTILLQAQSLKPRLHLHTIDAISMMRNNIQDTSLHSQQHPDICYLDPMFPPRTKSAAVKKNMQILQGLLHSSASSDKSEDWEAQECIRIHEEQALLQAALSIAKARVVVKRPRAAEPLGGRHQHGPLPTYALEGSINRWDIYVINT